VTIRNPRRRSSSVAGPTRLLRPHGNGFDCRALPIRLAIVPTPIRRCGPFNRRTRNAAAMADRRRALQVRAVSACGIDGPSGRDDAPA
jgi:hypothetical protein